jgi:hypothetical protein
MNDEQERRVEGVQRIPVQALVEVCGADGNATAFEAESRNVSGRGIGLRTAYLPEVGTPVVCRFDTDGHEVVAEGVIAWRHNQARGGECGMRFTALDAKSAQVLGQLCHVDPHTNGPAYSDVQAEQSREPVHKVGTKVKLHIDGLSSPMRARVNQGDSEQLTVKSSLEFLKLGKRLQVEDIEAGQRSQAYIDGIDVVIDPETGVPSLMVLLRADETENTPEPSVIDTAGGINSGSFDPGLAGSNLDGTAQDGADSVAQEVAAMRSTLQRSLSCAGLFVRITSLRAISLGRTIGERGAPLLQRVVRSTTWGTRRAKADGLRRRTAPPPSHVSSTMSHGLRPQSSAAKATEVSMPPVSRSRSKVWGVTIGVLALLTFMIVLSSRSTTSRPVVAAGNATGTTAVGAAPSAAVAVPASPAAPSSSALVAPVPLFGPTPMATLESAPLGAALAPGTAETPAAVASREMAAAKAAVAQVAPGSEDTAEPAEANSSSEEPAAKPEDIAPWGKGKMRDPVIYRVRLDGPGAAIKGTMLAKGFSVMVPKRKAEESPKGYVKRDKRIEKVSAANADGGVRFIWRFKDEVPGYRVRLRKNTIEFLISAT